MLEIFYIYIISHNGVVVVVVVAARLRLLGSVLLFFITVRCCSLLLHGIGFFTSLQRLALLLPLRVLRLVVRMEEEWP